MNTSKPSQDVVRACLDQRKKAKTPPPSIEEIRRQLGWYLKKKE